MNISIQKAVESDYETLKSILDESDLIHLQFLPHLFKNPDGKSWDKNYVISLINGADSDIYVAKAGNTMVGVMVLIIKSSQNLAILKPRKFVMLDSIAIKKKYRNQGIGRILLSFMEQWAFEKKIYTIELNVYEFNSKAIKLYEDLGFTTYSRRMTKCLMHE